MLNFRLMYGVAVVAMAVLSGCVVPARAQEAGLLPEEFMLVAPADSAAVDSVAAPVVITPDSMAVRAADEFKRFQMMKFDGEPSDVTFPAAYSCYESTAEALAGQERDSRGYQQCKQILRDVDGELLKGAFFYSGKSDRENMDRYARAYLDIQLMPQFEGEQWQRDPRMFPNIAYVAASSAYNAREWDKAIEYFRLYFASGATEQREKVYMFMAQACLKAGEYPAAIDLMHTAIGLYPANDLMPMIGIQACVDGGNPLHLQEFLDHALSLKPQDERLLIIQGQLYEDEGNYRAAIDIFTSLEASKPNSLTIVKHLGMGYYNQAVSYYNQAINEKDEKAAKRLRRQAKNYFEAANTQFGRVLEADPMALKYLKAQGVCYLCMDDKAAFMRVNERLTALGEDPLGDVFMPPLMSAAEAGSKNFAATPSGSLGMTEQMDAPRYADYARDYITSRLEKWTARAEFETNEAYSRRVNDASIREQYNQLTRKAAEEYLRLYANKLRVNNLKLEPYDADNEVFKISSNYGPIYLPVPLKDNEAEIFKATFAGVQIKNPSYFIDEEGVRIGGITFVTPGGKSYVYDNSSALAYNGAPEIDIDFNSILRNPRRTADASDRSRPKMRIGKKSDVDENIPESRKQLPDRIALVIANEEYANVPDVNSAINDGSVFAEYCRRTLGMPEQNVTLITNATLANILRSVTDLKNKAGSLDGRAEVFVYYAGHGMPSERTKDAYILPVDGDATVEETCYPLARLYDELGSLQAKSVTVFIDACFSGAQRQQQGEMLVAARSVVIKPKEVAPKGNMLVLSAASGNETALPYAEKNHGLFTYYLLKRLQETKGNTTLKSLSDYVIDNVRRQSNFINSKPQTPTATVSGAMSSIWESQKLRP